jgi:hypothetical protein
MKGANYGYRERDRFGFVDNVLDWRRRRYSYSGGHSEKAWVVSDSKSIFDKGEEL